MKFELSEIHEKFLQEPVTKVKVSTTTPSELENELSEPVNTDKPESVV
jgi:hypothetical protein